MATTRPLISRGERAPDFVLPRGADGEGARFYGFVGGRPAVVLLAGDEDVRPLAEELRAARGDDLDVHVVSRAPNVSGDGAFHDPEGGVHRAYGATDSAPVAVVTDPNVRVAATVAIGDGALDEILAAVPKEPENVVAEAPRLAPVLFVPDALSETHRESLIERWETEGAVETGVEVVVDGEHAEATDIRRKRRRDHVVEDRELLRELTQHIGARVFPELQKAFAFQAGGFEGFKIGCYTDADRGHFESHRDNLSSGTAHRRFGISINLNDGYEGGELRFPEYGATRYRPAAGEALVFSGSHLHEVLPVERGRRFVLLSFVLARGARSR
ncbi:MAG: 2OG-Fe(II) oxygenase [Nitriliruptorales bacterium]|nr:2OG-Fe(II) oxygenase [Nitriliruptorales bacterium]